MTFSKAAKLKLKLKLFMVYFQDYKNQVIWGRFRSKILEICRMGQIIKKPKNMSKYIFYNRFSKLFKVRSLEVILGQIFTRIAV